jgi:Holliday junction resolvase-like predicted endonuclease
VEVKVVDHIDELHDYVTPKKLGHLRHTIEYYLLKHANDKEYWLDVVFVKNGSIQDIYNNVTNT